MFCMISISFTHLRNINKKQVNSFKIAMRQLNSSDQICIFILSSMVAPQLHFWISLKDVKYFSFYFSIFLPLHFSKNQDPLQLCPERILTMCFTFCAIFYLSIILRVIQRQIVQIKKRFSCKTYISM